MNEKDGRKGLVLGGGGARGCYEIGSWQAFHAAGRHFDCVSGTSIGAIVAAIYVQQTLEEMVNFVDVLTPGLVVKDLFEFPASFNEAIENRKVMMDFVAKYINTGVDIEPLKKAFDTLFHYELFKESSIDFACWTFNISSMSGQAFFKKDITKENARDIILASASCFPAFPVMNIGDQKYIDGGYENNVPADLAVAMGAEELTVIDVHGPGRVKPLPQNIPILYIQPLLPLGNFLDFGKGQGSRSMQIGYLETMKYLNEFCGYIYTFEKKDWPAIFVYERYVHMIMERQQVVPDREQAYKVLCSALGYRPPLLNNMYQNDYDAGLLTEALAYLFGVNPVCLYSYKDFLRQTMETFLKACKEPETRNFSNPVSAIETFRPAIKKEEVILFFNRIKNHGGRLPFYMEPAAKFLNASWQIAWCAWITAMYLNIKV